MAKGGGDGPAIDNFRITVEHEEGFAKIKPSDLPLQASSEAIAAWDLSKPAYGYVFVYNHDGRGELVSTATNELIRSGRVRFRVPASKGLCVVLYVMSRRALTSEGIERLKSTCPYHESIDREKATSYRGRFITYKSRPNVFNDDDIAVLNEPAPGDLEMNAAFKKELESVDNYVGEIFCLR